MMDVKLEYTVDGWCAFLDEWPDILNYAPVPEAALESLAHRIGNLRMMRPEHPLFGEFDSVKDAPDA